jgi:hypothetical protein
MAEALSQGLRQPQRLVPLSRGALSLLYRFHGEVLKVMDIVTFI